MTEGVPGQPLGQALGQMLDRRAWLLGLGGLAAAGSAAWWSTGPASIASVPALAPATTPTSSPGGTWDPPVPNVTALPQAPTLPVEPPGEVPGTPPPRAEPPPVDPSSPAWMRYAQAYQDGDGRPVIAIIVDDVGIDRARVRRTLALPPEVTLAVMTYASDAAFLAREARAEGHEVMAHVPMQPTGAIDPGPQALTLGLSEAEVLRRLRWGLDRVPGAVGLNNHMGSRFTEDGRAMAPVLAEVRRRRLLFVDSRTSGRSVAARESERAGIPTLQRQVFLDNDPAASAVRAQLTTLIASAKRSGRAIAIGHPYDSTLALLADWVPRAAQDGVSVVPITSVYRLGLGRA
ncbi:MAG: divergent polysaccharide deacetylase family protein [Alphaproteobacteria bacterium]|nr:divergent polysaccharide deacetylase family protein [Alphaproteobacteria bacterium]